MEELRRLAFKHVADELEDPAGGEQANGEKPKPVVQEARHEHGERDQDCGNPESMAKPVDRVLMTARVSRYPLLTAVRAQHGAKK